MKHGLRKSFIYVLARVLAALVFLLPIRIGVFLGGWIAVMLFYLLPKYRYQAFENLSYAFGRPKSDAWVRTIAIDVFKNLGLNATEFINFPKIDSRNIDKFIDIEGIEKIDDALKDKKGCIALSCHLGNWELSAIYFGLKGYFPWVIVRPLRDRRFDRLVNALRRSKNINIISRQQSFKKIVSLLKENNIVGILPDQDIDSVDGVFVDFFGKKAYTPSGPVILAMVSGSPIFPAFCIRQNGRHKLIIEDEIKLELTGDREKDILTNTQKWTDVVENYISRYPEQWVWMHRRWKTQPI